jgi:hypothetical protein
MLAWDEIDVLTCLEVVPEVAPESEWHRYVLQKDGLRLELLIHQDEGDVYFDLFQDETNHQIFHMKLLGCSGIRYVKNDPYGYLEFAPARCFGARYDGRSLIPMGVRLWPSPGIKVELF